MRGLRMRGPSFFIEPRFTHLLEDAVSWSTPVGIPDLPHLGIRICTLSGREGSTAETAAMRPCRSFSSLAGDPVTGRP